MAFYTTMYLSSIPLHPQVTHSEVPGAADPRGFSLHIAVLGPPRNARVAKGEGCAKPKAQFLSLSRVGATAQRNSPRGLSYRCGKSKA